MVGNLLRFDCVGALLDRGSQLRDPLFIDRRKVAEPLFKVGELAGSTRNLHILRATVRGTSARATAHGILGTLRGATCTHRCNLRGVDSTYFAGHSDSPGYLWPC